MRLATGFEEMGHIYKYYIHMPTIFFIGQCLRKWKLWLCVLRPDVIQGVVVVELHFH